MGLPERVTEANRNQESEETRQRTTRENPLRYGAVIGRAKRPLVSFIPRATGGGVGGFSALIRSALSPIFARLVSRAPALEISVAAIRGKTGPVPNGAVLFGPFSWAYKKKDEEKTKAKERGNAYVCPERGSSKGCPTIECVTRCNP